MSRTVEVILDEIENLVYEALKAGHKLDQGDIYEAWRRGVRAYDEPVVEDDELPDEDPA